MVSKPSDFMLNHWNLSFGSRSESSYNNHSEQRSSLRHYRFLKMLICGKSSLDCQSSVKINVGLGFVKKNKIR